MRCINQYKLVLCRKTLSAHFTGEQILSFGFSEQYGGSGDLLGIYYMRGARHFNPRAAELIVILHSFEAGIAEAVSSFEKKLFPFAKNIYLTK